MKTKLLLLLFLCSLSYGYSQTTSIPDPIFEQALIDLGHDNVLDGSVLTTNISSVPTLNVNGLGIANLTGIEDFTALAHLYCKNNVLTTLDFSQNTSLTELTCTGNPNLTSLDVTLNIALQVLYSNNTKLSSSVEGLDVTNNIALLKLGCKNNGLTNLNLTNNVLLTELNCSSNLLTSLDVSTNTALTNLNCSNNLLTSLNVKNGNNSNMTTFRSTSNPDLTCIEVDNPAWSATTWTNIDPASSFNHNCTNPETYVPDDSFETYLEEHDANGNVVPVGDPTSMGNGIDDDDYVTTANIAGVFELNVNGLGIANLTGIEDFTALTNLICYNNSLTVLDVSYNTNLLVLNCKTNDLTTVDCSNNQNLTNLNCNNNQNLTSLNITLNTALITLRCNSNKLTVLDLSQHTALTLLDCSNNLLTSLNVKNGNNHNMPTADFDSSSNPGLTCIIVDDKTTTVWTNIDPASTFVDSQIECNALGIEDYTYTNFSASPNPTKHKLNITIELDAEYRLSNMQGQTIKTGKLKNGNNTLNTSYLSSGIYFLTVKTEEGMGIEKIIKQ